MFDSWLSNSTLPALEQTAAFAQRRHQLLAGNLANIDTPDYQTRDISVKDFQSQLKAAIESPQSKSTTYVSGKGHLPISQQEALEKARDVSKQVLYHDGHDVSLEQQVTEISKKPKHA